MPNQNAETSAIRLAVIGCGAVTEICHLPAAQLVPEIEIAALVDANLARAQALGERFRVGSWAADYRQLPEPVDGVILALPNHLHAPVTLEFLERGIPVLVEKPMALTVTEAEAMVTAAAAKGVALQVGLMYRFCNGARLLKRAVEEGWLGRLRSFSLESGLVYDWPVTSRFIFSKDQAGGGELVDIGSHTLDLLLWWLGEVVEVEYRDDCLGGVEAECWLSLVLQGPTGPVPGTVTLSRLRKLNDTVCLVGEHFTIEYDLASTATLRIWPTAWNQQGLSFALTPRSLPRQSWNDVYANQLRAFAQTIATGKSAVVTGEEVARSVALIERCYRERQPLEFPWMKTVAPLEREASVTPSKREAVGL